MIYFQSEEPPLSFYGVYDGHAGKDAAAFAASHLHGRILSSPHYPTDPVEAIRDAFNKTDDAFLDKVCSPVMKTVTLLSSSFFKVNTYIENISRRRCSVGRSQ